MELLVVVVLLMGEGVVVMLLSPPPRCYCRSPGEPCPYAIPSVAGLWT